MSAAEEQEVIAAIEKMDARPAQPAGTRDEIPTDPRVDLVVPEESPASAQAALYAALSRAQGAFPPIPRDRTVRVQPKDASKKPYTFNYAPLDTVLGAVRAALAAEGLAVTQLLDGNGEHTTLRTQLLHAGGGMIESVWPISSRGTPQEFGSALTYLRRYTLVALLGIASEEDDDGNHASGNTATATQEGRGAAADASGGAQPARNRRTAPTAPFDRDKAFKGCKAIERKLLAAGLPQETFDQNLVDAYGTAHVSELDDTQLADLLAKLRDAEKKLPT